MLNTSHSDQERRLLLETTLFQEETTPETLNALLDQLGVPPAPFSPEEEWAQFQRAHPEHFRRRSSRRGLFWAAAVLCLLLAAALPAARSLFQEAEPSTGTPAASVRPEEARAVLYGLIGLPVGDGTPIRAELPFAGVLEDGPARLPFDGEFSLLPFVFSQDAVSTENGSIVSNPDVKEAP